MIEGDNRPGMVTEKVEHCVNDDEVLLFCGGGQTTSVVIFCQGKERQITLANETLGKVNEINSETAAHNGTKEINF